MNRTRNIYLDYQASTPVDSRVLDEMQPFNQEFYANPHTTTHRHALLAARAVDKARSQVADVLHVTPNEILFTSGATESNNLAILGIATDPSKRRHTIVTQATEHSSVLEPIKSLKSRGFTIKVVGVQRNGIVDLDKLRSCIDNQTLLVSIMLVNNETGVIQPLSEIADLCKQHGALLHCDCAQVIGRLPLNLKQLDIDLATFSAHKIYGPKGVGALFVRRRVRNKLKPIHFGGGQQGGLRPGTLAVPLCVGMGCAFELAEHELPSFVSSASQQIKRIKAALDSTQLNIAYNGFHAHTAPGCLSVSFLGIKADFLLERWRNVELSTGSACEATKSHTSHVLRAMNISRSQAESTVRISVGRFTSNKDIEKLVGWISETFKLIKP